MTFKVEWSEPAICDLEKMDRYLRRRNPTAANKIGELLLKKAGMLAQYLRWDQDGKRILAGVSTLFARIKCFIELLSDKKIVEISHLRHGSRSAPSIDELLTE